LGVDLHGDRDLRVAKDLHHLAGMYVAIGDGRATEGIPFTEESVRRMLTSEPMAAPGAACLALAWRHRDRILGL
jgi:hypothetical protein